MMLRDSQMMIGIPNTWSPQCDPMRVLYERRCAKYIYVVPEGLRELMSDISREVLRCHPSEMCCFIADYLESLMITRENAKVAAIFVENLTDTSELVSDLMMRTNLSKQVIERSAKIIQRAFRRKLRDKLQPKKINPAEILEKMVHRLKITMEEASSAAIVIQQAYRYYRLQLAYRARRHSTYKIDWQVAAQRTFGIFRSIPGVHPRECQRAAILIQAAYRGYYTRKYLRDYWIRFKQDQLRRPPDMWLDEIEEGEEEEGTYYNYNTIESITNQQLDEAARTIQRFFRNILKKKQDSNVKKGSTIKEVPAVVEETPEIPKRVTVIKRSIAEGKSTALIKTEIKQDETHKSVKKSIRYSEEIQEIEEVQKIYNADENNLEEQ